MQERRCYIGLRFNLKISFSFGIFMRLMQIIAVVLTLSFLSFASRGATLIVEDFCSANPLLDVQVEVAESMTVSDFTLQQLQSSNIAFQGAKEGINSILSSPTGMVALDVLNDQEMRAFGWCYTVDGQLSDAFMHQQPITNQSVVRWFFAYSYYQSGVWTDFCLPATYATSLGLCR